MVRRLWLAAFAAVAAAAAAAAPLLLAASEPEPSAARAPATSVVAAGAAGTKLTLFNGKDLAGWKRVLQDAKADPAKTWSVVDGVLRCSGQPAGYIRTEQSFKNYLLVIEWRWPEQPTNSGVLLHVDGVDNVWPKSIEAQLESGNAGDFWLIDGAAAKVEEARRNKEHATNVKAMAKAELPPGEWNRYEITAIDGRIVLVINGELVNVGRDCTPSEGFIALQSEGSPIEFRKVELTPIP